METIVNGKWTWYQISEDLKQQAGYEGVRIDPRTVRSNDSGGTTADGNRFLLTWVPEYLMMISLLRDEKELIEAFATVVEYRPFCKYRHKITEQLITYEWDKKDPEGSFAKLQQDLDVMGLQPLTDESHTGGNKENVNKDTQ